MSTYRAFPLSADGHVNGPALIIEAPDDLEAVGQAQRQADARELPLEVWQSDRRVRLLKPVNALRRLLLNDS